MYYVIMLKLKYMWTAFACPKGHTKGIGWATRGIISATADFSPFKKLSKQKFLLIRFHFKGSNSYIVIFILQSPGVLVLYTFTTLSTSDYLFKWWTKASFLKNGLINKWHTC